MTAGATKAGAWFPWNGSKRWLIPRLEGMFGTDFARYVDPFVGSGVLPRILRCTRPKIPMLVSDVNPWLMGMYEHQQIPSQPLPTHAVEVSRWREMTSADASGLDPFHRAIRFGVCLLTAWGNRWKTEQDGRFTASSAPLRLDWCRPEHLLVRLERMLAVRFLGAHDAVRCGDWKDTIGLVQPGDLVYLDPPYPECLGYGSGGWHFSDLLDIVDWCSTSTRNSVRVVVSNIADPQRLFDRIGFTTSLVETGMVSKTRRARTELIATNCPWW